MKLHFLRPLYMVPPSILITSLFSSSSADTCLCTMRRMRRTPSSSPHLQLASASTLAPSSSQQDPSSLGKQLNMLVINTISLSTCWILCLLALLLLSPPPCKRPLIILSLTKLKVLHTKKVIQTCPATKTSYSSSQRIET